MIVEIKETVYKDRDVEFDGLTLLSEEQYEAIKTPIPNTYWWWLRSPGYLNICALSVLGNGSLHEYYVNGTLCSVRPALIIKSAMQIGTQFKFYGRTWTVVSERYALCDDVFCELAFRQDFMAEDANSYEASDVKKYLDAEWEKMRNENN